MNRRDFLSGLTGAAAVSLAGCRQPALAYPYLLNLAPVLIEVEKGHFVSTIGYNGSAPGPPIHLREGEATPIDIENDLDWPEWIHWHGLTLPGYLDGTREEGNAPIPAHGRTRQIIPPQTPGLRWVHTQASALDDFTHGLYTGQFSMVYVEPRRHPGDFDQEEFLAFHEWEPYLEAEIYNPEEVKEEYFREQKRRRAIAEHRRDPNVPIPPAEEPEDGWRVQYERYSINGFMLGQGDPVRVAEGRRVLFHFLNGSASEVHRIALPGHRFLVKALDGNPVPRPQAVDVLELGPGERVDAIVEMKNPGVWVLGATDDKLRAKGMGIVVEYAGRTGEPAWQAPPAAEWTYAIFGDTRPAEAPQARLAVNIAKVKTGSRRWDRWRINGREFQDRREPELLHRGVRYRMAIENQSEEPQSLHLHRYVFELASVQGTPVSGIRKDVVMVKPAGKVELDFTPEEPGLVLLQSQQQPQFDHGLKLLYRVV